MVCAKFTVLAFLCMSANECYGHRRRGPPSIPTHGVLEEVFRWKQINFHLLQNDDSLQFPDEDQVREQQLERESAARSNYTAYNNIPIGVTHFKGRLFVTVPRRRAGIPSTLNYISLKSTTLSSPSLRAYPNYRMNELHPEQKPDANRLVSVYRPRIDACNRLWFVDTGMLEYPNANVQIQRPSIWVMDADTDIVLKRFEIPESIVMRGNGLASITVDVDPQSCDQAFAYIPDLATYHLYTYDFAQNRIWSWSHEFFNFDPTQNNFNVAGHQVQWKDGIFSITLGPKNEDGYRTAYFHPMVSNKEFSVSTKVLQDETRTRHDDANVLKDFNLVGVRGPSTHSAMHDYDPSTGAIFYSQLATNGVSCWNVCRPLNANNFVHLQRNNDTMIYPSDLNVDSDGTLWVLTNSIPVFIYGRLDESVYNFRVWRAKTSDLVRGNACNIQ